MTDIILPELFDEEFAMYVSKRYILMYQPAFDYKSEEAGPYQIVNKTTGVVEFENNVLAGVLEMLLKFEIGMDAFEKQLHELNTPMPVEEMVETITTDAETAKVQLIRRNLKLTPIDMSGYRILEETITDEDISNIMNFKGPEDDESTH